MKVIHRDIPDNQTKILIQIGGIEAVAWITFCVCDHPKKMIGSGIGVVAYWRLKNTNSKKSKSKIKWKSSSKMII
jgi:hypothetical protein